MRETKFRGKRLDNGEWEYGDLVQFGQKYYTPCKCAIIPGTASGSDTFFKVLLDNEVDPVTVGQYTGLKDKNGKEIYEGDTITWLRHRMDRTGFIEQGHVEWRDIDGCYVVVNRFDTRDRRELIHLLIRCTEDIKVVGNIHDNPELLKGGEK